MSEEKLYVVKNDEVNYWFTVSEENAKNEAKDHGGHVVTLVEEPKKVVVSPEESGLVKNCLWTNSQYEFLNNINLLFQGRRPEDVTRLKSALINGYTVASDKKYNVRVPYTDDSYFYKVNHETCNAAGLFHIDLDCPEAKFTKLEINHYHLQDFKKEEVTDDEQ